MNVLTIARVCAEIDRRAEREHDQFVEICELSERVGELEFQLGRSEDRRHEP